VTSAGKIPLVPSGKSRLRLRASCPKERFAIVTDVGCGMRWTLLVLKTNAPAADGEVVWSGCLDAGINSRQCFALRGDGGNKARSPERARRKPLKPFAQERPERFGGPVVTCSCAFLLSHARLRVRRASGFSCALCFEGHDSGIARAKHAAGMWRCVFSSPSPRSYGERVGVRGFVLGPCKTVSPLTRIALDDATHRQEQFDLSPQAGRGDSKSSCLLFDN
jgi:hypothetical protein